MSTVVSGTLRDAKGQLWTNAPIQFIFQPTYGVPGPYTWSGGVLNKLPPIVTTDGTGHFTITLPANSEITPASSLWQCAIGPSATLPAVVLTLSLIPGALDISSLFSALAITGLAQSLFVPRAYSDAEVIVPPNSGQLYYDVVAKRLKFYEDGVWNALAAAGSGMIYPGVGIAVSTGTAWGPSLDPATIARTNGSNTFTPAQTFTADITANANINCAHTISAGASKIQIGAKADIPNLTTAPTITASGQSMFLNCPPASAIFLMSDSGGAVVFGDGAGGAEVGRISNTGDGQLNKTFKVGIHSGTNGTLVLGGAPDVTDYATNPSVTSGFGSLQLNALTAGAVFLCMQSGAATVFGNGAGTEVGRVSANGNATFSGTITAAGKTFRIPHPLDETKDLVHSCLEGPEWGVYYRGEIVTQEGSATVVLPNYFEALTHWENRTVLVSQIFEEEDEALSLVAAGRIVGGTFRIRTSAPSAKVAWQVNAIRKFGDSALEIEPLRSNK